MADKWDVEFSSEKDVVANHPNILADQRKDYKGMLVIKVFQVYVEVAVDNPPPKTHLLVAAAKETAEELQRIAIQDIDALAKEVADLQGEEKLGNKKAAETAKKLVEKVDKALKKLADEFGLEIRKAVQKALIGKKEKLRSSSRSVFRGVTLDEDAFDEDVATEVPSFFDDTVKQLAAAGKEAYKLSGEEADNRQALIQSIKGQMEAIDKSIEASVSKGGKGKFDMELYVKENSKDLHKLSQSKQKYVDFVKDFDDKLEKTIKELDKVEKLSDKDQCLKDNKLVGREYGDYRKAAETIRNTFDGKLKAADQVDDLFTKEWKNGAAFMAAQKSLENQPSTMKSGKAMEDSGKELEKLNAELKKLAKG